MRGLVGFALVVAVLGSVIAVLAPAGVASPQARGGSGITALTGVQVEDLSELRGVPYSRYIGIVHGRVAPDEHVVGLALQPRDAEGFVDWSAQFEVIRPTAGSPFRTVVVESEILKEAIDGCRSKQ